MSAPPPPPTLPPAPNIPQASTKSTLKSNEFPAKFKLYQGPSALIMVDCFFGETEDTPLFLLREISSIGTMKVQTLYGGADAEGTRVLGDGESKSLIGSSKYDLNVQLESGSKFTQAFERQKKFLNTTYYFKHQDKTYEWRSAKDCVLSGSTGKSSGFKLARVPPGGKVSKNGSDDLVVVVPTKSGPPERAAFEVINGGLKLGSSWCALVVLSAMKVLADNGIKPDGSLKRIRAFQKQAQEQMMQAPPTSTQHRGA